MRKIFRHISNFDSTKLDIVESKTTENGRKYHHPDGKSYPSVTTVMGWLASEGIAKWREKVGDDEANKVMFRASKRGTNVHDVCERYLLNEEHYIDTNDHILMQSFTDIKQVLDANLDDIYCLEKALYSDFLGLAGKTDCIGKYKNKRSVVDFKTSRKLKKKHYINGYLMQATAYSIMFEELTGISIPNIVIIITVDHEGVQVFEERRDNYVDELLSTIKKYRECHD
jgi:genome maintenance exonuclease 1